MGRESARYALPDDTSKVSMTKNIVVTLHAVKLLSRGYRSYSKNFHFLMARFGRPPADAELLLLSEEVSTQAAIVADKDDSA